MKKQSIFEKVLRILPLVLFFAILMGMYFCAVWNAAGAEGALGSLRVLFLLCVGIWTLYLLFFGIWMHGFLRKIKAAARQKSAAAEFFDAVEERRETVLYLYELTTFLSILLCFLTLYFSTRFEMGYLSVILPLLSACLFFIIILEIQMRRLKKGMRLYFPKQKGNVYGSGWLGFSLGEWMQSSDEGEQMIVYKAVYRTYRKVKAACVFLFVFFGMLTVCGDLSPGPMMVAALFRGMLTCIFYYERKRLRNAAWEKD
ncbi:DUF3169 family protein [Zhenpiania hominis]|uniref:DUF3169 family protein n=1 Tax=Zhenpiania hominis TaxID=2763644 RepID=A0A923NIM5_9FIRM|nr:DUF3169 family protein [Zhenpiania hominis]MBC6678787.1 DUF3169 family protein [Zhenpiania hominis]